MEMLLAGAKILGANLQDALASIRNFNSMRGNPAGAGGTRSAKRASERQFLASSRSPWRTWMSMPV